MEKIVTGQQYLRVIYWTTDNTRQDQLPLVKTSRSDVITVARCKEIITNIARQTGKTITSIEMYDYRSYDAQGREIEPDLTNDPYCEAFVSARHTDKRYDYTVKTNSLVIYKDRMPVYANDNGVVCRDEAALCDSLFD